jgi:hypothetical protein
MRMVHGDLQSLLGFGVGAWAAQSVTSEIFA